MSKLIQELQRLYCLPDHNILTEDGGVGLNLLGSDGSVRAMVLGFERAADWVHVACLFQGLQDDLDLPPPAISVSGLAGYQLWLSLADAVPLAQAESFMEALRQKYLADMPLARLKFYPSSNMKMVGFVPVFCEASQKWSAFIDPTMGAMFVDESGLEMSPNQVRQADMLAGLKSVVAEDFHRALALLLTEPSSPEVALSSSETAFQCVEPFVCKHYADPKSFLLAVMNDSSASLGHRIQAATALLPVFSRAEISDQEGGCESI